MSWKASRHYWYVGPIDVHVFTHALDDGKGPSYVTLGIGRREWFVWPWRGLHKWHAHMLPGAPSRWEYDARYLPKTDAQRP